MRRRFHVLCILIVSATLLGTPTVALGQGGPLPDASAAPQASSLSVSTAPLASATASPAPAPASPSASADPPARPVRGPALRERGGRRSRGASAASGALMLFILIGFMGYYVVKKLRR